MHEQARCLHARAGILQVVGTTTLEQYVPDSGPGCVIESQRQTIAVNLLCCISACRGMVHGVLPVGRQVSLQPSLAHSPACAPHQRLCAGLFDLGCGSTGAREHGSTQGARVLPRAPACSHLEKPGNTHPKQQAIAHVSRGMSSIWALPVPYQCLMRN